MNEIKRQAFEEILIEMDQRIIYSLNETPIQEREDLKQEIYKRLLEALERMEVVSLDTFIERKILEEEVNEG
ncbi:hypothetical protein [Shouchella lehensis]|uniref:Uncharacterized protein n=1 Tax=Shouchella lehensis TaxID=300825 RepID=A0A4Y7WLT1_9BACI|nr:hypothetical protein [Shouchella lehensis]MBG9783127.1 hypothetical protein [Shouchella lehensis]TES49513.1 hypothetical protein E2L03_08575 [Shouchella lehensis]